MSVGEPISTSGERYVPGEAIFRMTPPCASLLYVIEPDFVICISKFTGTFKVAFKLITPRDLPDVKETNGRDISSTFVR